MREKKNSLVEPRKIFNFENENFFSKNRKKTRFAYTATLKVKKKSKKRQKSKKSEKCAP